MDPLKLLAYIVALIIVVAVAYNLAGGGFIPSSTPIPMQHSAGLDYKPKHIECPSANTSSTDVYRIDFLKILGGIDHDYIFNVNLSGFNITKYLIEYAKLGLLIPIGFRHNGSTYELHMLPISENDEENLTSKAIYLCFPPKVFYPLYLVRNSTSELFIKNSTVELDIPSIGRGGYGTWLNVVTPPPYAELSNLAVGREVLETTTVEGYGEVLDSSLTYIGSGSYGPYCWRWEWGNHTYEYCYSYTYHRYTASWSYTIGYRLNGSVAYSRTSGGSAAVSGGGFGRRAIHTDSDGYYMGFGPLTRVEISISYYTDYSGGCGTEGNTTSCYYHYEYGVGSIDVDVLTRGLRMDTKVNASVDFEPAQVAGVEPINISVQKHAVLGPRDAALLPVHFSDAVDVCSYLDAFESIRCLSDALGFKPARKSFAGYLELRYVVKDFDWPWGSVVDLPYEIAVENKLYPPPHAPDIDLNRMFYSYLQDAVLRYVANISNLYASQTGYGDFEAWALSTQIPIQMNACGSHSHSYMPLVEALQDGCGSDSEKVEVLSRALSYLGIDSEVKDVAVRSAKGLELVELPARAVYGYIDRYPSFYNLAGIGCALPVSGMYAVVYDTVQNSIFSVLDRVGFPRESA